MKRTRLDFALMAVVQVVAHLLVVGAVLAFLAREGAHLPHPPCPVAQTEVSR